jgi:NitT/TauT family transport system permease protein
LSVIVQDRVAADFQAPPARQHERSRYLEIQTPVPRSLAIVLGGIIVVAFFGVWQLVSVSGLVNEVLLPGPSKVLASLIELFTEQDYLRDVGISLYRIMASFAAASLLAVPLGILMGSFSIVAAAFNPLVSAARYLPAPSFIPLLLMWLGPTDAEKLALLFIGVVWFLVALVMDATKAVPRELIDTARTFGASRRQILATVIIPASLPSIVTAMRQMLAISWTYLVIAEIVAADGGIGAMMMRAQRYVHIDLVMAGIITIGALGIASDALARGAHRLMFSYLYLHEKD